MPVAERAADIAIASAGKHIAQLVSVVEDRIKSKFPDEQGDGKAGVWYWNFKSKTVNDETGERETFRHMTAPIMSPNNNNTKFWKRLMPGVEYEELTGDTDDVVGQWFEVEIVHEKSGDKTYANIGFIKPYVKPAKPLQDKKGKPVPAPTDDEIEDEDPYADD